MRMNKVQFLYDVLDNKVEKVTDAININSVNPTIGLCAAAGSGNVSIFELLLERGANPNQALCWAVEKCQPDLVKMAFLYGAEPNPVGCHFHVSVRIALRDGSAELIDIMLKNGVNVIDAKHEYVVDDKIITDGCLEIAKNAPTHDIHEKIALLVKAGAKKKV